MSSADASPGGSAADVLVRLQDWYASNCDGDWEHSAGVRIESLDNPGWTVRLDIVGTPVEGLTWERVIVDDSEENWLHHWADGASIRAAGGPHRLKDALEAVLDRLGDRTTADGRSEE
ncbi:immunity 53 family protein [Streptomyces sp. NPDC053493]|uniref:immunity 53 family protein n=1 Tax=Streptomyces sp. NPDC053493 TaxID=3365705 RepID=UPI0037CF510B